MKKRIISLAIATACTLTSMTAFASAPGGYDYSNAIMDNFSLLGEEYDWGETDNTEVSIKEEYTRALDKLTAIGVAGDESFLALADDAKMTRAQFVALAVRCTGIESYQSDKEYFFDVDKNSEYAPYIAYATERGYISGDGGLFRPDSNITYLEASAILIKILGQSVVADLNGGWPSGYTSMAKEAGITDDVKISDFNDTALKGDLYIMLVNALESDYCADITGASENGLKYKNGTPMLEKYFGIYQGSGVMTVVGNSGSISEGSDDRVIINDVEYIGEYYDYIRLLGYNVNFWYTKDYEMVYAEPKGNRNETLLLSADDVVGLNGNKYEYKSEDHLKSKYATIASEAVVIYNGRLASSSTPDLYSPEMGYVKLISNDGDTTYEYVIIESYKDYVIGTVNTEKKIIYNDYANADGVKETFNFDEEDKSKITFVSTDGKEIVPRLMGKNDVVSVKASADGKYVEAIYSSESVSGAISKIDKERGKTVLVIDDKRYTLTNDCSTHYADAIKLGENVTVKLDCFGYGAAVILTSVSDSGYAYLISAVYEPNEERCFVKMVTAEDHYVTLETADKCVIDGKVQKNAEKIYDAIIAGIAVGPVVTYKLDSESGKITNIDTPFVSDKESADSSVGVICDSAVATDNDSVDNGTLKFKASGNFQDKVYLTSDTAVFTVYDDSSLAEPLPIYKKYRARKMSTLGNDKEWKVVAYANSKTFVADAVIITRVVNAELSVGSHELYAVIDCTEIWDENKEEIAYEIVMSNGTQRTVLVSKDEWEDNSYDVTKGDLIRCDTEDGYVAEKALVVEYDASEGQFSSASYSDAGKGWEGDEYKLLPGFVYEVRDNLYSMYATKSNDKTPLATFDYNSKYSHIMKPSSVVVVKKRGDSITVTSGSTKDMRGYLDCGNDCSRVAQYMTWYQHSTAYILDYED